MLVKANTFARPFLVASLLFGPACSVEVSHHHCCGDGYYDDGYYDGYGGGPACNAGVVSSTIDTGGVLELDPGRVGLTAEYLGGGAWRFAMACDTPLSGAACNYQVSVVPIDGSIDAFAPESLESDDYLTAGADGSVNLDALTDADLDGFTLDATPGSALELTVALDGSCASPYVFWLSNGDMPVVSSTSIDLVPSAP